MYQLALRRRLCRPSLDKIFSTDGDHDFPLGKLSMNKDIDLMINGNRFFSKHIAVVGSTGSGKSCTVASVLQGVVGITQSKNNNKGNQNNSHIVIFDIHDEYTAAFTLDKEQSFTLSRLDIDSLQLPYWLRMVFKTPVKPEWRERCAAGTMAS